MSLDCSAEAEKEEDGGGPLLRCSTAGEVAVLCTMRIPSISPDPYQQKIRYWKYTNIQTKFLIVFFRVCINKVLDL